MTSNFICSFMRRSTFCCGMRTADSFSVGHIPSCSVMLSNFFIDIAPVKMDNLTRVPAVSRPEF